MNTIAEPVRPSMRTLRHDARPIKHAAPPEPRLPTLNVDFMTGYARDICQRYSPSEAALRILTPEMAPHRFLEILGAKGLHQDAVQFLANALSKYDAVRWGCKCVREAVGEFPPGMARIAIEAAERWAKTPTEENRRQCGMAVADCNYAPATYMALAAFWSGGSIGVANGPTVLPADDMTAQAVIGAVEALVENEAPPNRVRRYQRIELLGLCIASGA